ncbi:hypothetical protein NDI54_15575 [Haloarcula sp. S1AR25-5A]|uniref:HVO-2928 N-terminal domain-containing protein n=1 Tax=Haloarcula terrestris TaxID=2950533 RepID=A0AAE4F1V8_9EURY|nr:hypothetical protein [Haloarcula terrestris]MDS0222766.1 hypothetical protein [Haloarcula terrestris]
MKGFEFTIRFDPGADPLMDLFREYPALLLRNATCTVAGDAMWRVDRVDGPADAVSAFGDVFLNDGRCNECLDGHRCPGTREYQVLDRGPTARTVYTYHTEIDRCRSVAPIVTERIDDGVVFASERTGGAYRWRVLSPAAISLDGVFGRLESALGDGLALDVDRIGGADLWQATAGPAFPQ